VSRLLLAALITAFTAHAKAPVITIQTTTFGRVLAAPDHLALYYWTPEKRDHRIRCSGACATAWPPLYAKSVAAVPKRIASARGTFGVIRRPDGRLQVTYDRLPLYTYHGDPPNRPLCNNVDGWFVVRA
jgi:predicted lipoprotein with Yx(FWY)xxD motif